MATPSRFSPRKPQTPLRLLVFTEGSKTEPQYLAMLSRQNRAVSVKVAEHHHQPLPLAKKAVRRLERDRRASRSAGDPYDEYWVVFDWDAHPQVREAVALAEKAGVHVALSVPCLEIWFLWHFEDCNRELERGPVQARAYELLRCTKGSLTQPAQALLLDHTEAAVERAGLLAAQHQRNGLPADTNPSSGLGRLVQVILHARNAGRS